MRVSRNRYELYTHEARYDHDGVIVNCVRIIHSEIPPLEVKMISRRLLANLAHNGKYVQTRNFSGNAKDAKIGIIGMGGVGKVYLSDNPFPN